MSKCFKSINPFTGELVSAFYVRKSVVSRPGHLYCVSRLDGSASWEHLIPTPAKQEQKLELGNGLQPVSIQKGKYFSSMDVCYFGPRTRRMGKIKNLWVIGGTHGNEYNGVLGVQLLKEFLSNPQFTITQMLYDTVSVSLAWLNAINRVGYMANARCCPNEDSNIKHFGQHVMIEPHQHTSLSLPLVAGRTLTETGMSTRLW
jgi:hypothetical protein